MASGVIPHSGLYGKGGMFMGEALITQDGTAIVENEDLNTQKFTATGKYFCNSAAVGRTLSSRPDGQNLFTLLVYNPHNSETGVLGTNSYRYRIRILIGYGGDIYIQRVHCEGNTTILYETWNKVQTITV